ncbi:MAG: VWA domain-containing protein [Terriglobales bacterium]
MARLLFFLMCVGMLTVCPGATAQHPILLASSAAPATGGFTVRKSVDEVHLQFRVTDRRHQPVTDLLREQVEVFEGATQVEPLLDFRSESSLPLHVALLLDASDSTARQFAAEQQLAAALMRQMIRRPEDRALVFAFGTSVRQLDAATADAASLEAAIAKASSGGQTALYTAVVRACDELRPLASPGTARRVIILLSDGNDTYSYHTERDAQQAVLNADAVLYSIRMGESYGRSYEALRQLAQLSGGQLFKHSDRARLTEAFARIDEELRSQYVVAFRPAVHDGRFHRLEVRVNAGRPVTVAARAGYWAPRN